MKPTPYEMRNITVAAYQMHGASPQLATQIADAYNQLSLPRLNGHLHNGHEPHPAAYFLHGFELFRTGNTDEGHSFIRRAVERYPDPVWEHVLQEIESVAHVVRAAEPMFAKLRDEWSEAQGHKKGG
ncbi:MAG: hypothetical protein HYY37_00020 [Candidatus Aenigmarchaeota archaeon]|nr:hypothetical protein [Candidatus Aenigmarchaeota archaeon]